MIAYNRTYALVAQWIERLPPEQKVTGSNPAEGAMKTSGAHGAPHI